MSILVQPDFLKPQGRVLSTLEGDGSRRWMYPRLSKGKFWKRRRVVAYSLIALFAATPYLKIAGKPVLLLDVVHRRFTILGTTFLPTDTVLLALLLVGMILAVFAFTAVLGRAWCGWACPQTVYMEFLVRPIERLFTGRVGVGGKLRGNVAAWRKGLMYATFFVVCLHLANTFLAYFVPPGVLHTWITSSPLEHPAGFTIVAVVTGLMLFDFCWFREQTCIIACPYGRFQSVLMDRQSLVIQFDETRTHGRDAHATEAGCIDCEKCVEVCPTGIDIRQGLQFECIGCAQCIDACADVKGLVGYGTQSGGKTRIVRGRVMVYAGLVAVVGGLIAVLIATKSGADVTVMRSMGRPYVMTDKGEVENTLRVKVTNRTDEAFRLKFSVEGRGDVRVIPSREMIDLKPLEQWTEPVQVIAPVGVFNFGATEVTLRVSDGQGVVVDRKCRLLGPMGGIDVTR